MATVDKLPAAVSASTAPASGKPGVAHPKKKQVKKSSKPRSVAAHPSYLEMIVEAVTSLKERSGSSQHAIAKFIDEKHKAHLPPNFNKLLLARLRKFSASGKLTKVKNSYKVPAPAKKLLPSAPVKASKPAASKLKPKSAAIAKPKAKQAVKPKKKVLPMAKPKAVVKVLKPKPKTVAAKPLSRPAKAAKKSANDAPGKKVVVAKKPVVAPKAMALAKKAKGVKAAAKAPVKKTRISKAK